jgi:hypothetical protein
VRRITKVTFTQNVANSNIHFVVWQFWGRAAEASWTEKSRTLFLFTEDQRKTEGRPKEERLDYDPTNFAALAHLKF